MQLKSFPSSVGSSWTYEWEDRWSGAIDTVVVTVAAEIDSFGVGPVKVWTFTEPSGEDTLFMTVASDSIRFLHWLPPPAWNTKFVFPLHQGAEWAGDFVTNVSRVTAVTSTTVPAGRFRRAFQVEETWGAYNANGHVMTWLVPDVGIVMEDHWEIDLGPGPNYVRRLLSYEIVEEQS
jgi:hypothetical protein